MTQTQTRRYAAWSGVGFLVLALIACVAWLISRGEPGDSFFGDLFKTYQPRQFCMLYDSRVIWLHLLSDAVIALAYYSIPIALVYFVRRRTDLRFSWMFVCFAVFILACGTTHVMNIVALWWAPYRIDGLLKLFTAAVSIATAIMLWPLIPRALALPSPARLRDVNEELEREVETRRQAEESLRAMHLQLEERVEQRTAELRTANERLEAEVAARTAAEAEREALLAREREARSEAERANRLKDDFLATVSHELRTPLGAITGWTHLLRETHESDAELVEGLDVIERNTRIQSQLIDDLLDLSRIVSGKLRLDVQPTDLAKVVEAAVETVRPSADSKAIQIEPRIDPALPLVSGDAARLQQVVWNLLTNAIKFTSPGGYVRLAVQQNVSHVRVTVSDNGAGISPEFLPHLFERFRQADASTTRRHGGLGIGLALVRHLVELHGGTVKAESAGEGKGAAFTFELPLRAQQMTPGRMAPTSPSAAAVRLEGVQVLLVEDDRDSREVLRRILTDRGATVFTAGNAAEGLALLSAKRPTVLVSDIGMPGQDGYAFIQKVRQLPPDAGGETPAIALSAFARAEDRIRAIMTGFQTHLAKPVDPSELVLVLHSLATRPHAGPDAPRA